MMPQPCRTTLAVLSLFVGSLLLGGCRGWVSPPPPIPIFATFVGHVNADQYQEAYDMTSPAFRTCVTNRQFEEFCKRRNLPRPQPELLEPDRRKFPYTGAECALADTRLLPFSIGIVKGEDGKWYVDFVMLHEVDNQLNLIK